MTFSERVQEALGPAFRAAAGPLLGDLVDGLTTEVEEIDALVQPTAGGWATMFDLDTTPMPAWLGAATGTKTPAGLTTEQQRAYVRARASWRRGSVDALAAAVGELLTAPQRVGFVERRDGNAWHLQIQVYAGEITGITEAEILAAANTQKPIGLVIDGVTFTPAITYADLAEMYADYTELAEWSYPIHVEDDLPGARWWKPANQTYRFARLRADVPTLAGLAEQYPTLRDLRDHNPQES